MRKSKKVYTSPYPTSYSRTKKDPENLKRQEATNSQKRWDEDTIIYGADDALPIKIANAVAESPAATACIDTTAQFIKGSGFSDKELMKLKIDESGTTLWDLHTQLSDSLALFKGFATNFKFNDENKITNTFRIGFESCRFKMPVDGSPFITCIKYNPYFGTGQYEKKFTKEYPVFNLELLKEQIRAEGTQYCGQVYYYGKTDPIHRFYPVPKYWSAEEWIYIDSKIQRFHRKNLDNGFFQSVLMTIIGNPNRMSTNPAYQIEYVKEDGTKGTKSTKTIGEEFNEMMQAAFSGVDKAGNVLVQWAANQNEIQKIQEFPSRTNDALFETLQNLTTENITIGTQVPSILANISKGVSLGSTGNEMQKAVELMQSRTVDDRTRLEQFYNEILLPNLATPVTGRVTILNFNPVSEPVQIEDKFWEFLNDNEKIDFLKKNYPGITINRPVIVAPAVAGQTAAPEVNENLKNLTGRQLQGIQRIVRKFNKGELTLEQASGMLKSGFGFTDNDVNVWLITPEEE